MAKNLNDPLDYYFGQSNPSTLLSGTGVPEFLAKPNTDNAPVLKAEKPQQPFTYPNLIQTLSSILNPPVQSLTPPESIRRNTTEPIQVTPKTVNTETPYDYFKDVTDTEVNLLKKFDKFNTAKTLMDAGLTTTQFISNALQKPLIPLRAPILKTYDAPSTVNQEMDLMKDQIVQSRTSVNALRDRNVDTNIIRRYETSLLDAERKGTKEIALSDKQRVSTNIANRIDVDNRNAAIQAEYDKANRTAEMETNAQKSAMQTGLLSQYSNIANSYIQNKFKTADQLNQAEGLYNFINSLSDDADKQYFLAQHFMPGTTYINREKESMADEKGTKGRQYKETQTQSNK